MQNEKLAPVFLDNQPVNLQDPNPKVSAILSACGLPDATDLKWVQFQPVNQGRSMRPDETLDRTSEPAKPIYLTSAVDGKFAGPSVLRGKTNIAGGQQAGGGQPGQSGQSQGSQKQAHGSGSQSQTTQKPGSGGQTPAVSKPASPGQSPTSQQPATGDQTTGSADTSGHGGEGRRPGQRPEPASQRNKPEQSKPDAVEGSSETEDDIEAEDGKKSDL